MKKLFFVSLCVVMIIGAVLISRYPSIIRDIIKGGSTTISAVASKDPSDISLTDIASFRQDNDAWGRDKMGATSDTLAGYGCTITSVANAISNVTGTEITPKTLNQRLGEVGGYTNRGWLIWAKVADATNDAVQIRVHNEPSHSAIQACMNSGAYPIVKIKLGGVVPHWVMLVGRKDGEYIMRDPLLGSPADGPLPLSTRSNKIHSLRCLSKL